MAKTRISIRPSVEAMKPGGEITLKGASNNSVKTVVARVKADWPNRFYQTKTVPRGVLVRRIK